MRKLLPGLVLLLFLSSLSAPSVYALSADSEKKLEKAGKKVEELIEKYKKKKLDKYNEVNVTIKDTDGNPRDCTVRLYYNDYKQERLKTDGGKFNSVFNHGETIPTKLYSVAVYSCPCVPIKIDVIGPTYPGLTEEIEKIKGVITDELEGEANKKLTKEGKALIEKAMTKVFEGMGHAGATWAKRFMKSVSVGMDLGAPFKAFFDQEIAKLFDAFVMQDARRDKLLDEKEPKNSNRSIIKEEWKDYVKRGTTGSHWNSATTKYEVDVLLKCYKNYEPNEHLLDWKRIDRLPPITPPTKTTPPIISGGGSKPINPITGTTETVPERNARIERENEARAAEAARRQAAREKAEAERKAEEARRAAEEKAAQEKAERIKKECKKCEKIKTALDTKRGELDRAWEDANNKNEAVRGRKDKTKSLENKIGQAQKALNNFNDPGTDYAESDGQRVDGRDLAVREAAANAAWEKYRSGELTAHEVEDYWEGLDAAEVASLRAAAKAGLEKKVADEKAALEAHKKSIEAAEKEATEAQKKVEDLKTEVEKLENAYKDCLKKCQDDKKVNILKDYGVGVTQTPSPIGQLWPWNWGKEIYFNATVDPEIISQIPSYTDMTYEMIVPDTRLEVDTKKAVQDFHSVLNEISQGSFLINQHQASERGQLINASVPVSGVQNGGELAAALQIIFDDTATQSGARLAPENVIFSADYNQLDEKTDKPLSEAGRKFVLTFSEPMDKAVIEDSFAIRTFTEEHLKTDKPSAVTGLDQNIWDDSAFDVNWDKDDTEATFTFDEERALPDEEVELDLSPGSYFIVMDGVTAGEPQKTYFVADPARNLTLPGLMIPVGGETKVDPPALEDPIAEEDAAILKDFREIYKASLEDKREARGYPRDSCEIGHYQQDPSCGATGLFDGEHGYAARCQPNEECEFKYTLSDDSSCYGCVKSCEVGQHIESGCSGLCDANQACVPTDRSSKCFECIARPFDIAEPEEKEEIKIGEDPLPVDPPKEPEAPVCNSHKGQYEFSSCLDACSDSQECISLEGTECFSCEQKEVAPQCPINTSDQSQCNQNCDGECVFSEDVGGLNCYSCIEPDPEPVLVCPGGSFPSESECTSGGSSCVIGGSQGELNCWVPQASCEDLCSQNGFSAEQIDFTGQLEAQLNSVTCVSSYQFNLQQATVGDCTCYGTEAPTVTFDMTSPVCAGSVCGDVTCGESISCPVDGGTATATCNWGGWTKEAQYQYRPSVGGQ